MRIPALAACWTLFMLPPCVGAQDAGAEIPEPERAKWLERVRLLQADTTDWSLIQDLGEKGRALAPRLVPVVLAESEAAAGAEDSRYRIRVLGVLTRIEPRVGVPKLAAVLASRDDNAAVAARMLGRCAPATDVASVVTARLPVETRGGVASALALAAGDAGATMAAHVLREWLEEGKGKPSQLQWFAIALAQVADQGMQAEAAKWLQPGTRLAGAGLLLVRRTRDTKVESTLLEWLPKMKKEGALPWLVQTLGAIGGDATRAALRTELAAKLEAERQALARQGAIAMGSTEVDPMRLALLRLGDPESVQWAMGILKDHGQGAVGEGEQRVTFSAMSPEIASVPELVGKWNVAGTLDALANCAADPAAPAWLRAHAARGLCWRRDVRGLTAAAAILAMPDEQARDPFVGMGLEVAQRTLLEFVADLDRPDYVPIDEGGETPARGTGPLWQRWLAQKAGKVTWREPFQDSEDMQLWY